MEKLVKQIINRPPGRKMITWPKDWMLKLLSVFFAVFLWYFVAGEDKIDTNVFIPVEIVNMPRDLVISNQYKKQLEVTISGPRGLINGIAKQHISRTVNLSKAKPGTMVIRNDPDSISLPRGITVLRIQPTHMTLLIDRLIEKDLPIKATIIGKPARNFELTGVKLDPSLMALSGPQTILGEVTYLPTAPINITGLKGPITRQVGLNLKPAIADLVGEPVVSARVIIKEKRIEKLLGDIPVTVLLKNEQFRYRVKPRTVTIRLKAPVSMAGSTPRLAKAVQAHVSVDGLPPGEHTLAVDTSAPGGMEVLSVKPPAVTVKVRTAPPAGKEKK